MAKQTGFSRQPLGQLGPAEEEIQHFRHPRTETLTDASTERKRLLEDCRSGYITQTQLHDELLALNEENKK